MAQVTTETAEQWTTACIEDLLVIKLTEKEEELSGRLTEQLSSNRRVFVMKYLAEFMRVSHLIIISDYTSFPAFRLDPSDLDERLLKEMVNLDKETQDLVIMDAIFRIIHACNRLTFAKLKPQRRRMRWEWKHFNQEGVAMP